MNVISWKGKEGCCYLCLLRDVCVYVGDHWYLPVSLPELKKIHDTIYKPSTHIPYLLKTYLLNNSWKGKASGQDVNLTSIKWSNKLDLGKSFLLKIWIPASCTGFQNTGQCHCQYSLKECKQLLQNAFITVINMHPCSFPSPICCSWRIWRISEGIFFYHYYGILVLYVISTLKSEEIS